MKLRSKRIAAAVMSIMMAFGNTGVASYAADIPNTRIARPGVADLSREVANEGMVLLKNDNGFLPLSSEKNIALFGRTQIDTFYSGYGSGGCVQMAYQVNILDGMRKNPKLQVNEELAAVYEKWCKENPSSANGWSGPHILPEMPVNAEVMQNAAETSNVAVVVLGQAAGETWDNYLGDGGGYYLSDEEKNLLKEVNAAFDDVVVILNNSNIIDMTWVEEYSNVHSVLMAWQGGMEMGSAIADVISGDVTPSGKLADTIARNYEDYPSSDNFGNGEYNNYEEDIFVGYRYFETFAQDKVLYPFGFGLSYTEFEINTTDVTEKDGEITVTTTVTNVGDTYSGKEVVEVYYGAPQGELGKASKNLAGYVKTNTLAPGASQTVTVSFPVENMASYDDAGKTGHKSAWVLEAGDYPIYVGNSVREAEKAGTYTVEELTVTEQLEEANAVHEDAAFERYVAQEENGTVVLGKEQVPTATVDLHDRVAENLPTSIPQTEDKGIKLIDVANDREKMDDFIAQLTDEDLIALTSGAGGKGDPQGPAGNASVYGGTTASLKDKGVIPVNTADGPSGLSLAVKASLVPIGTLQACTWNDSLIQELYYMVGEEMGMNGVDALLGPGMNIHRDPLCGRNFEYFSEDPLLSGVMAANNVIGMQNAGASAVPKHFALNSQENNRNQNDSRCSERAQREIYLRAFEICVKTSKPYNLMGSYNKVNGEWSHYNYEMNTTILREQWGYEGVLMTDWWIQSDTSDELHVKDNAYRVRSQEDVLMPGGETSSTRESYEAWKAAGAKDDDLDSGLTLGELQRTARTVLNYVIESYNFRTLHDLPNTYKQGAPWFETTGVNVEKAPQLIDLTIDGMERFNAFNPVKKSYEVFVQDMNHVPTVNAVAEDGCTVKITQATTDAPLATITVTREKDQAVSVYRVYFSNQAGMDPVVDNPIYARLKSVQINGKNIIGFYPTTYEYSVKDDFTDAEITAKAPEGVTYEVTKSSPEEHYAIVRAESSDQAMEYYIQFPAPKAENAQSDDFEGDTELKPFWQVISPNENMKVENGEVVVTTEQGQWYGGGNAFGGFHNLFYQQAPGNWTATVEMEFPAAANQPYHQWGLVVFDDNNNNIDVGYCSTNWGGDSNQMIQVRKEVKGSTDDKVMTDAELQKIPITEGWDGKDVTGQFRVKKQGDEYTFYFKTDLVGDQKMEGKFKELAKTTMALSDPKLGVFASNGDGSALPVDVKIKDFEIKSNVPQNDDFEGDTELKDFWNVENPVAENLSVQDGALTIKTEKGEWYGSGNGGGGFHNVVYQPASGNWTATVDMEFPAEPNKNYRQWGLVIFDDNNNNIDFGYCSASFAEGGQTLQIRKEEKGSTNDKVLEGTYKNIPTEEKWSGMTKCSFRVRKWESSYTFYIKTQAMDDYMEIGTIESNLSQPKFGLFAANGATDVSGVDVKFTNVAFTEAEAPEEVSPVVTIKQNGESKIKAAEKYVYMSPKLQLQDCGDTDGGQNIAYAENGEYVLFAIDVEESGWYDLNVRMASASGNELTQLGYDVEVDGDLAASFSEQPTGAWQTYKTTGPKPVYLEKGEHTIRVLFRSVINLNWLSFTRTYSVTVDEAMEHGKVVIDKASAVPGDTVSLTVKPDNGYVYTEGSLKVHKANNPEEVVEISEDNTFIMPEYDVIVTATFEADQETIVDKTGLTNLIAYAKSQQAKDEYQSLVPVVKAAFEKALAEAEAVSGKADATQAEVDAAYDNLLNMVHMLDFTGNSEDLATLVDGAKGLNEKLFTKDSWDALQKALAAAEEVLADENALQEEIDAARDALQSAMNNLVKIPVDKSKLQKLVDQSKKYEDAIKEYTPATAEIFKGALDYAREILANEDATQEEIDAAYAALQNAIFGLRLIPNKDKLNELIKEAEKTDFSKYTEASGKAVKAALAHAKEVFADENATKEDVKGAEKELKAAMKELQLASNEDKNDGKDNNNTGNNGGNNNGGTSGNKTEKDAPKTGDHTSMVWLFAMAAAVGVVFFRRRKSYK